MPGFGCEGQLAGGSWSFAERQLRSIDGPCFLLAAAIHRYGLAEPAPRCPLPPVLLLVGIVPMYLGMVMLLAGIAVGLGSAAPWLVIPVFVWLLTARFIVAEERKLENTFGRQYVDYKAKVRRWC